MLLIRRVAIAIAVIEVPLTVWALVTQGWLHALLGPFLALVGALLTYWSIRRRYPEDVEKKS